MFLSMNGMDVITITNHNHLKTVAVEIKYYRTLFNSITIQLDEITESLKKVILWNLIFIFKYKETKKV